MKQIYLKPVLPYLVMISFLLVVSCTEIWDEHYDVESFDLPDKSLNELIQDRPDLSIFSGMLKQTGYDSLIGASQSFTIWAPTNTALVDIDTTNTELVLEIVKNHIARSRFTTSGIENEPIRMLNGKNISFNQAASAYNFGNYSISDPNLPAKNGLVHILDGYVPYIYNLWEYISKTEGLDSIKSYLSGQSKNVFYPGLSTEIGTDSANNIIYDSVFIFSNPILTKIGAFSTEDSIYSAIIPDNTAWNEAYNRIEGFFNFTDTSGGAQRQRELTQYAILQDMAFRGNVTQPVTQDLLVSTTGNVFYNPGFIFANTKVDELSNGLAYVTSQMPYSATQSWFKEIHVEAENLFGRKNINSTIFLRSSYGSGMDVSDSKYILLDPASAIAAPSAEFSIPNTLSAKYNIYCVFVPARIVNENDLTPTKAKFKLTYIDLADGSVFVHSVTPENNITNPGGVTKMFVDQFDFEYANVVDEEYKEVKVKLEVINDVTSAEEQSGDFSRIMRIDCIIFEPVLE